jgi:putative transposase
VAKRVRDWLKTVEAKTLLFIEAGSPWENGYVESFNGKLRDELLNREVFDALLEAKNSSSVGCKPTTWSDRTAHWA